jgi:phosphoenolpyruvate carboxykinase (ATP)
MVKAALDGRLAQVPTVRHPIFGVAVPQSCPGVRPEILNPQNTWSDPARYDAAARDLAQRFRDNFVQYHEAAGREVIEAGPQP